MGSGEVRKASRKERQESWAASKEALTEGVRQACGKEAYLT